MTRRPGASWEIAEKWPIGHPMIAEVAHQARLVGVLAPIRDLEAGPLSPRVLDPG